MAEDNTKARFGWNYASEVKFEDEDGNLLVVGETPPEIQKILEEHQKKLTKSEATTDRATRRQPKVKLHIHRR